MGKINDKKFVNHIIVMIYVLSKKWMAISVLPLFKFVVNNEYSVMAGSLFKTRNNVLFATINNISVDTHNTHILDH